MGDGVGDGPGVTVDPRVRAMLETNARQAAFYESRSAAKTAGEARERSANLATSAWTTARRRIMALRRRAGAADYIHHLHRSWLGDLSAARVLDLGCFDGNHLSEWMAATSREYHGIDLSADAVARLEARFRLQGLARARAYVQDLLANEWPTGHFDAIYAYSVLHHFADLDVALDELRRLLRPGGVMVALDPLQTEPFNRAIRALYRPVQSDRDWEFPFTRAALRAIGRRFRYTHVRGIGGAVKLAYPLYLVPALEPLGDRVAAWGLDFDDRHTRRFGLPLYLSWHVTMRLERRD